MKKQILTTIFLVFSFLIYSQYTTNITPTKPGKKNGEVVNLYCFKKYHIKKTQYGNQFLFLPSYFKESALIDWRNSIKKISINEVALLMDSIKPLDERNPLLLVVERCVVNNGVVNYTLDIAVNIKISNGQLYSWVRRIESGKLLNDKCWQEVKSCQFKSFQKKNYFSLAYFDDLSRFSDEDEDVDYTTHIKFLEGGILADQRINFEKRQFKQSGSAEGITSCQPFIEIENQEIKKIYTWYLNVKDYSYSSYSIEVNFPEIQIHEGNRIKIIRYTQRPYCWKYNSYFTKEDNELNEDFNTTLIKFTNGEWNKNTIFLEQFQVDKLTGEINGDYCLYLVKFEDYFTFEEFQLYQRHTGLNLDDKNQLAIAQRDSYFSKEKFREFSESQLDDKNKFALVAKYSYFKGEKKGPNYFYNIKGSVVWKINYENDLLHGVCERYYEDGSLGCKMNFEKGLPIGEAVSYYNSKESIAFFHAEVKSDHSKGGVYLPMNIFKFYDQASIKKNFIETVKNNNGKTSEFVDNQIFNKCTYLIDSIPNANMGYERFSYMKEDESVIYNNNKPIYKVTIDHNSKYKAKPSSKFVLLDETGKVVYTGVK